MLRRSRGWRLIPVLPALTTLALWACVGEDPDVVVSPPPTNDGGPPAEAQTNPTPDTGTPPPVDGGSDATGTRFCDTKAKPLASTDFFCSDFDVDPFDQGWTKHVERDASVDATTTVASSPPRSTIVNVASFGDAGNQRGAALEWSVSGANVIDHVEVEVAINKRLTNDEVLPATANGTVTLVTVESPDGRVRFMYTRGGSIPNAPNYTGYYLRFDNIANPKVSFLKIDPVLTIGMWTRVKLVASLKSWTTDVYFNDLSIGKLAETAVQSVTSTTVRVGAVGDGSTINHVFHFDDVTAAVFR